MSIIDSISILLYILDTYMLMNFCDMLGNASDMLGNTSNVLLNIVTML